MTPRECPVAHYHMPRTCAAGLIEDCPNRVPSAAEVCHWSQDDSDAWMTECRKAYGINEGTPEENRMKFCPFCGKELVGVPYVEELETGESKQ